MSRSVCKDNEWNKIQSITNIKQNKHYEYKWQQFSVDSTALDFVKLFKGSKMLKVEFNKNYGGDYYECRGFAIYGIKME